VGKNFHVSSIAGLPGLGLAAQRKPDCLACPGRLQKSMQGLMLWRLALFNALSDKVQQPGR